MSSKIPTTMNAIPNVTQTEDEKTLAALLADPTIPDAMKAFLANQHRELARLKTEEQRAKEEAARKEREKTAPFTVTIKEPGVSKNGKNIPAQVEYKDRAPMPWFVASTEKPTTYWRALLARSAEILAACDEADKAYPPTSQPDSK